MSHVGFELPTSRMYNKLAAFTNTPSVGFGSSQGRLYKANRLFIKTKTMKFVIK